MSQYIYLPYIYMQVITLYNFWWSMRSYIQRINSYQFHLITTCNTCKYYLKSKQMDHSSEDLFHLFLNKGIEKQPYQLKNNIHTLFSTPHILTQQMLGLSSSEYLNNQSSLDIPQIFKLYESIDRSKVDSELVKVYVAKLEELVHLTDIKNYLKSANEMKYFFIIFLWNKLFAKENHKLFNLFAQLISKTQFYHQIFVIWLQDISADYLRYVIKQLHEKIKDECTQLQGIDQSEEIKKILATNCKLICVLFKLIHSSNKGKERISFVQFNNSYVTTAIEPIQTFKAYLKKTNEFSFIFYPFLLDFNYKYKLMQIESIYQQKLSIKKNMENGLMNLIHNLENGIEGLIYLYFAIRRNNILDDSMEKLGKIKQNLKSPLRIEFIGEEGADQGGVKNEYFASITKSIFNPYLDMFLPKNFARFYWFNGFSYELPLRFQFVGMLLGLSLYNSVHLDIHFPEVTFKKLLNKKYQEDYGIQIIEDLRQIEPQIYRTLKKILQETEDVSNIELYFNIELESFGEKIVNELVQDGNFIQVNNDNREYYCLLYADYILNKHIAKQFDAFRRGFYRVVGGGIIQTFQAEELRILIHGTQDIDMKELEQNTHYQGGYSPQTPVIRAFWVFLHTLNHVEKKNFLTFVTGTDRVPIDGLKSLKFLIQRHTNTKNLPTAHTCFNVLLLPEYENSQILVKNLRLILQHNQGFGLI